MLNEQEETVVEKKVVDDTPYASAKTFEDLGLSAELLKGLYSEMKFERPSKIQGETLPLILTPPHRNLIAQAHNGSGKTTCFTLGMLSRVDPALQASQALCICPTRELAIQVAAALETFGAQGLHQRAVVVVLPLVDVHLRLGGIGLLLGLAQSSESLLARGAC